MGEVLKACGIKARATHEEFKYSGLKERIASATLGGVMLTIIINEVLLSQVWCNIKRI